MWDSRPGCPKAGILPALQELDVIESSSPGGSDSGESTLVVVMRSRCRTFVDSKPWRGGSLVHYVELLILDV
jgi:hypothetical protein